MKILITGAAGFIGFHTAKFFLERGDEVVGLDNFNNYNDPRIKLRRTKILGQFPEYKLYKQDISDYRGLAKVFNKEKPEVVIHLAAQAGVRYCLKNPWSYAYSNYLGTLNVFEAAKALGIKKVIYASSSSIYGGNKKVPFVENQPTDTPISIYAATKKANELLAYTYSHLYGMNMTGLRFFTVYGDYFRLDMALFKFAKNIVLGKAIDLHGNGDMKREFTHVDDIVRPIAACVDRDIRGYKIYNLGGGKSVKVKEFLSLIERSLGKKAVINHLPIQPGELVDTVADINLVKNEIGFDPKVSLEEGISRFCKWFLANQKWLLTLDDALS